MHVVISYELRMEFISASAFGHTEVFNPLSDLDSPREFWTLDIYLSFALTKSRR